jgi:alkylated DNA nucleotide flippase Atl1
MSRQRKSWREKLNDDKDLPRVVTIDGKMIKRWGEGTLVIPAPCEVDDLMRQVPSGKVATINHLRVALAARHGTTIACPITAGIFARIAAGAATEDEAAGLKLITPYWRTLKGEGELNPKYPEGCEGQKIRLEAEGHTVIQKGKKFLVKDYKKHLAKIEP